MCKPMGLLWSGVGEKLTNGRNLVSAIEGAYATFFSGGLLHKCFNSGWGGLAFGFFR